MSSNERKTLNNSLFNGKFKFFRSHLYLILVIIIILSFLSYLLILMKSIDEKTKSSISVVTPTKPVIPSPKKYQLIASAIKIKKVDLPPILTDALKAEIYLRQFAEQTDTEDYATYSYSIQSVTNNQGKEMFLKGSFVYFEGAINSDVLKTFLEKNGFVMSNKFSQGSTANQFEKGSIICTYSAEGVYTRSYFFCGATDPELDMLIADLTAKYPNQYFSVYRIDGNFATGNMGKGPSSAYIAKKVDSKWDIIMRSQNGWPCPFVVSEKVPPDITASCYSYDLKKDIPNPN